MLKFVPDHELFQYPMGKKIPRNPYDVGQATDLSKVDSSKIIVYFPFSEEQVDRDEMFEHIYRTTGFRIKKFLFLGDLSFPPV